MNTMLELLLPDLKAIPESKIIAPHLPVKIILIEAQELLRVSRDDMPALLGAGLEKRFITSLPARIEALHGAQSEWHGARFSQREAQEQWRRESPKAYALRDELLHTYRYAFRKDRELMQQVEHITEHHRHADLLLDLAMLADMGREHLDKLQLIHYDIEKLDTACQVAKKLTHLDATSDSESIDGYSEKDLRDRAFTHLTEALNEIRECGSYLFWKSLEKRSQYMRVLGRDYSKEHRLNPV